MTEIYHALVPWAIGMAIVLGSIVIFALWVAVGIMFAFDMPRRTTSGHELSFGDIIFATLVLILMTFVFAILAGVLAPLSIPIMIIISIAGLIRLYNEIK